MTGIIARSWFHVRGTSHPICCLRQRWCGHSRYCSAQWSACSGFCSQGFPMTDLMLQFPGVVADARGAFHARAMACEREDGTWEGWLEFVRADAGASTAYTTSIETHQRDRVTMERWASGLTRVYAEGALSPARRRGSAYGVPHAG